jgi:hypothetical protein
MPATGYEAGLPFELNKVAGAKVAPKTMPATGYETGLPFELQRLMSRLRKKE